ncbi:tail fiber domain-containing protein [Sphingobium sp. WCS2017Hpa-17]|uniref:tail fiber domain-containing protein n=1 Tax=Sphingobium sp. WCS2017Hpa-17 TaxID=3073638 RepID=UPI00288A7992|nr:tail fiber domain-containing protein [Sphingobium sp. WCS2017Hpa-17]
MAITHWEMADLVREVCMDGGGGPLMLGGPLPGYRGFAEALSAGATFPYVIQGVADPGQWEAGRGTIDAGGRLVRVPHASSAGGAAVDFVAGEKHVGLVLHADWVARVEGHGHGIGAIDGLTSALADKQPASGELSAIAALATSGYGRGLLTRGDGAGVRAYVGALGSSGDVQIANGTLTVNATGAAFTSLSTETITAYRNDAAAIVTVRGDGVAASLRAYAYGTSSASMRLYRAQGTQAVPANLESGAVIGDVASFGYIGGTFEEVTRMRATLVSATPGSANKQVMFSWHATRDGSSGAPATLMRLQYGTMDFAGHVLPLTDNLYALGGASTRWSLVYAASGTINTSDARAKCDLGAAEEALIDAWGAVQWQRYRFVEAVAEKGDNARWHMGLVAQQVRDAIDQQMGEGAAVRWGLICHDRWDAEPEQRAEDGALLRAARAAGDRWGLRYDECFALEAAWQRRAIARLEARVVLLEAGGGHAGG